MLCRDAAYVHYLMMMMMKKMKRKMKMMIFLLFTILDKPVIRTHRAAHHTRTQNGSFQFFHYQLAWPAEYLIQTHAAKPKP